MFSNQRMQAYTLKVYSDRKYHLMWRVGVSVDKERDALKDGGCAMSGGTARHNLFPRSERRSFRLPLELILQLLHFVFHVSGRIARVISGNHSGLDLSFRHNGLKTYGKTLHYLPSV